MQRLKIQKGQRWSDFGLKIEHEQYKELNPGLQDTKIELWAEGLTEEEVPRPIVALAMTPRSKDGSQYMWLSGAQAREIAESLLAWVDMMESFQRERVVDHSGGVS